MIETFWCVHWIRSKKGMHMNVKKSAINLCRTNSFILGWAVNWASIENLIETKRRRKKKKSTKFKILNDKKSIVCLFFIKTSFLQITKPNNGIFRKVFVLHFLEKKNDNWYTIPSESNLNLTEMGVENKSMFSLIALFISIFHR